jgi:hypothetical protein
MFYINMWPVSVAENNIWSSLIIILILKALNKIIIFSNVLPMSQTVEYKTKVNLFNLMNLDNRLSLTFCKERAGDCAILVEF